VESLAGQSLLRLEEQPAPEGGVEPRLVMLDTIREFALAQWTDADEADVLRERHAAFFLAQAESVRPSFSGDAPDLWLRRITAEQHNYRAVLRWYLDRDRPDLGMRLVGALWTWFWRNSVGEGQRWTEDLLRLPGAAARTATRAKALFTAGIMAWNQRQYEQARARLKECVALYRDLADERAYFDAVVWLVQMTSVPAAGPQTGATGEQQEVGA
jgi:hypothetical protein